MMTGRCIGTLSHLRGSSLVLGLLLATACWDDSTGLAPGRMSGLWLRANHAAPARPDLVDSLRLGVDRTFSLSQSAVLTSDTEASIELFRARWEGSWEATGDWVVLTSVRSIPPVDSIEIVLQGLKLLGPARWTIDGIPREWERERR